MKKWKMYKFYKVIWIYYVQVLQSDYFLFTEPNNILRMQIKYTTIRNWYGFSQINSFVNSVWIYSKRE